MPKVTIWIRKEDYDYWQEIGDKPSFIHDAIRVQQNSFGGSMYTKRPLITSPAIYKKMQDMPQRGDVSDEPTIEPFEDAA